MLASPPSFMISPTVTLLFVCSHIVANLIPDAIIPSLSIHTELPLSILDAMTRSMLVCDGVDNMIKSNPNPLLRSSPMALLFTSTALGNVGFAFVNIFSMLSPNGWSVSAPPELGAYGWMTADLWVAPLMSALFATLTQSQPFWVELQRLAIAFVTPEVLSGFVKAEVGEDGVFNPMSKESARAVCAVFMGALFASRALKNGWPTAVEDAKKARKAIAPSPVSTTPNVKVTSLTGANGKFVQHSPKRRGKSVLSPRSTLLAANFKGLPVTSGVKAKKD